MSKPLIVVTGKNGQLGSELEILAPAFEVQYDFLLVDRSQLDLSSNESIDNFFSVHKPSVVINCAAYTAVDKAETDRDAAFQVNAVAVGKLAAFCKAIGALFITVSTDYVFDGNGTSPYLPSDATDPINYYGASKAEGEKLAITNNPDSIIIRTSWVYSRFGNNFVKTMIRLMGERPSLNVVGDQIGAPTYAADLAAAIMHIVAQKIAGNKHSGIYHFSNSGAISWYDFAVAIGEMTHSNCVVAKIGSEAFPTPAKRPHYSLMDCSSIIQDFGVGQPDWKESLQVCIPLIQK
ncbi:MAG: dTDP-4-dehydrorhamnose reductase [Bacteroidota bacterium]|jgi:dTDP-4-dehydrorhamnose reductase